MAPTTAGEVQLPARAVLVVLVVLWVCALVLGFVTQTTELFGARDGTVALALLGVACVGFLAIGAIGIWLVLRWLAGDEQAARERPLSGGPGSA